MGRWKALRPTMSPVPPARLLMTAVRTAWARSLAPLDSPPELMSADAAHVAVHHLPAGEVDRVVGGELLVDERVGLAELEGVVAAVVLGQLLLDDVGLDGDAEVVGLTGEVGRQVVVGLLGLEGRVAEIAPEDGEEAEGVGVLEGGPDLLELAVGLFGAEIDGGADADGTEFGGLGHGGEHDLVVGVGVVEELVVVELHDEGDLVGVATGHDAEDAQGGGDGRGSLPRGPASRGWPDRNRPGSWRSSPPPNARCPGRRAGWRGSRCRRGGRGRRGRPGCGRPGWVGPRPAGPGR